MDFTSPLFKPQIGFPFGSTLRNFLYVSPRLQPKYLCSQDPASLSRAPRWPSDCDCDTDGKEGRMKATLLGSYCIPASGLVCSHNLYYQSVSQGRHESRQGSPSHISKSVYLSKEIPGPTKFSSVFFRAIYMNKKLYLGKKLRHFTFSVIISQFPGPGTHESWRRVGKTAMSPVALSERD